MANTVINVSNANELHNALASATGGETILLAGGNYGDLYLGPSSSYSVKFPSNVTIKSVDPNAPASFSTLNMDYASNLTFDGVKFDYTFKPGDVYFYRPFDIMGSSNITIKNSVFDGDVAQGVSAVDDGFGFAMGLSLKGSSGVVLENNEFSTFHRGMVVHQSNNVTIRNNDVHSMRSDGMNFAEVQQVTIEDNYIHDFRKAANSSDHMDFIQFWTSGTNNPSTDIIIRGNTLDIGAGDWAQSIFMRNEVVDTGQAGLPMFYRNILIEDNTIYNGHLHGITVGQTDGLTIRQNTVLHAEGNATNLSGGVSIPQINLMPGSLNLNVTNNVTSKITGFSGQAGWNVANNVFVQDVDPTKANFYGNVFVTSTLHPDMGPGGVLYHDYMVIPGGMIDAANAGSSSIQPDLNPSTITPMYQVTSRDDVDDAVVFDASFSYGPNGQLDPATTQFIWEFGDGTTATGPLVQHKYPNAGYYDVRLTVVAADGTVAAEDYQVAITGDDLVSFDNTDGQFYTHDYGVDTVAQGSIQTLTSSSGTMAIQLSGTGIQATIDDTVISRLFGADNFDLNMTLQSNGGGFGEVFRIHGSMIAKVDGNGNINFTFFSSDGSNTSITGRGGTFGDGRAHDVQVTFDGDTNSLLLFVDGALQGSRSITGNVPGHVRDVTFGNAWGDANFNGQITDFSISSQVEDFSIYNGATNTINTTSQPLDPNNPPPQPTTQTQLPVLDDYVTDFAALPNWGLKDDAQLITSANGDSVQLDGDGDYIKLGRLRQFEQSDEISFSIDFTRDVADGSDARLVWNHWKMGLMLRDDGFVFRGATANEGWKTFVVDNVGLNDTNKHNATVMLDAANDRLQIYVDSQLVLDETSTDFDIVGAGRHEAGWNIGTSWDRYFDGNVSDFRIEAGVDFNDVGVGSVDDAFMAILS